MVVVDAVAAQKARDAASFLAQLAPVRAAYLFGSHLEGTAGRWSDIDVAAFVEGAEDWDFDRLSRVCGRVQRRAGLDVELHVFPASWFERPPRASFAGYILEHGVPLEIETGRTGELGVLV